MPIVSVQAAQGSYQVHVERGILRKIGSSDLVSNRRCFLLTTPRVLGLHGEILLRGFAKQNKPTVLLLPEGEQHKRMRTVERLASELAAAGARRDALLLTMGGGVAGDVGGFLAAIYMRGIDYMQIPTTLLAQVDASVGGKTGVNLPDGKNLIGTFHAPRAVFADLNTLQTLSVRELRAGLYECIKCGIIGDRKLFRMLQAKRDAILDRDSDALSRVITASVQVKAEIVQRDEHESDERMLLNFGHTIGHAIETCLHYKSLLHGEAVGWGMIAALHLSTALGCLSTADRDTSLSLIAAYGPLPRLQLEDEQLLHAAAHDKKNVRGGARYVLAAGIGQGLVAQGIPTADVRAAVRQMLAQAGRPR